MKLKLEWTNPQELLPDLENPRRISEETLDNLKESLVQYGFIQPVIYNKRTNQIVGGHQRVKAAVKEGLTEIPVIYVNWSKKKQKSANLALNRISGEWDYLKLEDYIQSIDLEEKDIDDLDDYTTGFTEEDLKEIRELNLEEIEEDNFDAKSEAAKIKKPKTKLGDLYILDGKHRLLCGDSTKKENVFYLLNKTIPILMVTDPPYGVNYDPEWRNEAAAKGLINYGASSVGKISNDDLVDWSNAYKLFPGDIVYVWHAGLHAKEVCQNLEDCNFVIVSQIIWAKPHFAISRGDYHWQHEPCWYAVRKGKKHNWQGSRKDSTLWEIANHSFQGMVDDQEDIHTNHSTQKPLECMAKPIKNNTKTNDIIYDPFLGSGTTLIAAEKFNRICYGLEIDPIYCDVIIERYKKLKPNAKIERIEKIEKSKKISSRS